MQTLENNLTIMISVSTVSNNEPGEEWDSSTGL